MKTAHASSSRPGAIRFFLFALGGIVSAATVALTLAPTAAVAAEQAAPALPLTASFSKGSPGPTGGPVTLTLTNTSKSSVKVSAHITVSVTMHANGKSRNLADHVIEAGKSWVIDDLVVGDKVELKAEGFASQEITVK